MLKKFTFYLSAIAVVSMFTTACKKDNKSAQELIMGKWLFHSYEWHEVSGSDEDGDTEDMTGSDYYLDFRNDGKVYMYLDGAYDTVAYSAKDNTTLLLDGDTIKLSKLSEKELSLYFKEQYTGYLYEEWYHFKK